MGWLPEQKLLSGQFLVPETAVVENMGAKNDNISIPGPRPVLIPISFDASLISHMTRVQTHANNQDTVLQRWRYVSSAIKTRVIINSIRPTLVRMVAIRKKYAPSRINYLCRSSLKCWGLLSDTPSLRAWLIILSNTDLHACDILYLLTF